jgi:hypothetical protein
MMKKYLLNMAGEYRVCAEILKKGYLASITMGNLKGADIHIVTEQRKVIVVEVKTTCSTRFVTSFYQKYKTKNTVHPDIWVLCQIRNENDRFFILTHEEMSKVQAKRNGFLEQFDWDEVNKKCQFGVDNVLLNDILEYENAWEIIGNFA